MASSNPRIFEQAIDSLKSAEDEKRIELKKQALDKLLATDTFVHHESEIPDQKNTNVHPSKPIVLKPVFIPCNKQHKANKAIDEEEIIDDNERMAESKALALSSIQAERAKDGRCLEERRIAGTPFDINSVDDSDDVDIEEAKEKWQEREAQRIVWDAQQFEEWKNNQLEAGHRQEMTEERRLLQDQEKQKGWNEQIDKQEGYKFLQKYYHKGAFYQDPSDSLLARNYSQATGSDSGVSRDTLPAALQVRNFGRKGRSKWTHLSAEDTTAFDYGWGDKKNAVNFQPISRMGGMRGDLENPAVARKKRRE